VLLAVPLPAAAQSPSSTARPADPPDLKALEAAFIRLAEEVQPSVVAVQTYALIDLSLGENARLKRPLSKGSGFIIGSDGHIVTNNHVVENADLIAVVLHTGQSHEGKVVQVDVRSDLAVLDIDVEHLRPVRWGRPDGVRVGQWAFACGNPFGLATLTGRTSMTYGIVSGLGRDLTDRLVTSRPEAALRYYGNLIETSAAINPGSSGGPLFNLNGQVIGIVTAIETSSGVSQGHGFAIPIDGSIRRVIDHLSQGEAIRYGFLGVNVTDPGDMTVPNFVRGRMHRGAMISSIILPDGPAARAGLRPNDVVIEFGGVTIENPDHLIRLVGFSPVGTEADITFLRKQVLHKARVTLADRFEAIGVDPTQPTREDTDAPPDDGE
jgi:serine protease Do